MVEDSDYFKMLKRMIRAGARRAGNGDEIELNEFQEVFNFFKDQMTEAVHLQLDNGKSWSDVAEGLGTSKQSAHRKHKKRPLQALASSKGSKVK